VLLQQNNKHYYKTTIIAVVSFQIPLLLPSLRILLTILESTQMIFNNNNINKEMHLQNSGPVSI